MEIGHFLNVNTLPAKEWLKYTYGAEGDTLYEAIQTILLIKDYKLPKA